MLKTAQNTAPLTPAQTMGHVFLIACTLSLVVAMPPVAAALRHFLVAPLATALGLGYY